MTDPSDLRIENLLQRKGNKVWEFRERTDAYTLLSAKALKPHKTELDHVLELHVARDCFDKVVKKGNDFQLKKDTLQNILKVALNDVENLNHTLSDTNQVKFQAVQNFQTDFRFGREDTEHGLVHYLCEANDQTRAKSSLGRGETRTIAKEIVKSYDHIKECVQGEDAFQEQFIDFLHENMVAMRLF